MSGEHPSIGRETKLQCTLAQQANDGRPPSSSVEDPWQILPANTPASNPATLLSIGSAEMAFTVATETRKAVAVHRPRMAALFFAAPNRRRLKPPRDP